MCDSKAEHLESESQLKKLNFEEFLLLKYLKEMHFFI